MLLASVMRIIWMTDMTTRKKSTRTITKKALRKHWKIHRSLQQPRKTARAAMNKKIPMRQCVGCGEMKNKREMMRVLKTPEGPIVLDATGRKNGRGAYLCKSLDCLKKARKNRGLERSFQMSIPDEVYDSLEKEFGESETE